MPKNPINRDFFENEKTEPWADIHGSHLGIKLTTNAMGWGIIRPRGSKILAEGRDRIDERTHVQFVFDKWREEGRPGNVVLYKYANHTAFRSSPDKRGMSLAEHSDLVDRVAAKLRRHGANVTIEMVEFL